MRLGKKRLLDLPVMFSPIPFFFLAIPRVLYVRPLAGFFPVNWHLRAISLTLVIKILRLSLSLGGLSIKNYKESFSKKKRS